MFVYIYVCKHDCIYKQMYICIYYRSKKKKFFYTLPEIYSRITHTKSSGADSRRIRFVKKKSKHFGRRSSSLSGSPTIRHGSNIPFKIIVR